MTDEQIIKALECCNRNGSCSKCPYDRATFEHELDCASAMTADALDLINRQRAEIEEQDQAIINALKRMGEIRAEAIKEVFAKLRANEVKPEFPWVDFYITDSQIKEIEEEMTEGTE